MPSVTLTTRSAKGSALTHAELDANFTSIKSGVESSAATTDLDAKQSNAITIKTLTGTTYTLVLADGTAYLRFTNASAVTVTVPANSSVAFAIGTSIPLTQVGAGQVTLVPGSGVTINRATTLKFRGTMSGATLTKVDTNEWDLAGDMAAT